jgi:hypothetical protein
LNIHSFDSPKEYPQEPEPMEKTPHVVKSKKPLYMANDFEDSRQYEPSYNHQNSSGLIGSDDDD